MIDRPRQQPAAQAADAEAGWLLGGEDDQLDRPPRPVTAPLQLADRLEPADHADRAVKSASVWNRVDMRAGRDGRQGRVVAGPAGEHVAHRIMAHRQPRLGEQPLEIGARAPVGVGEPPASPPRRPSEIPQACQLALTRSDSAQIRPQRRHASAPNGDWDWGLGLGARARGLGARVLHPPRPPTGTRPHQPRPPTTTVPPSQRCRSQSL